MSPTLAPRWRSLSTVVVPMPLLPPYVEFLGRQCKKIQNGEAFKDDADILITVRETLKDISWPQIPGLKTFEGEIMHSAARNEK